LLGQADRLRGRFQRHGEIDDANAAAKNAVDEGGKRLRMSGHLFSRVCGANPGLIEG